MIAIARRRIPLLNDDGRDVIDGYEYVDLGLPSGLLWATWNVGATTETGYGNYYQWGAGSTTYQNTNQYHTGGTISSYTLPSSADTATQVMGNGWRMPTQSELKELTANTTYSWATINGVSGGKFTSKSNPNAYVFFPAAGHYYNGSLNNRGSNGIVWSSTPYNRSYAYDLDFRSGDEDVLDDGRGLGFSVRGVHARVGKPMPPLSVLFVKKNDTTQKGIFVKDNWPSASDWTPIGIVVVPGSHQRYGNGINGIMSLGCLNTDGTMQTTGTTDSVTMAWAGTSTDTSLTNYTTCDGSNSYGYVQRQTNSGSTALSYYNSTPHAAYPYTDLTATENSFISSGSLSDYNGVGNTNTLNASASTYTAAAACKKFSTIGTSAGDWYLPAEGELAYVPSIRYQVNDTIDALNATYGKVGVRLNTSNVYWSSSEYGSGNAWGVHMYYGSVNNGSKVINNHVRAFLRF